MGDMVNRVQQWGGRYGWGVVVSAAPYVNLACAFTAAFAFVLIYLFFSLFGVAPAPPSQSGNPISWLLYLLGGACYAWLVWSYMISFVLIPLGAALSLADLLAARASKQSDRFVGAVAGLSLTVLPMLYWYFGNGNSNGYSLMAGFRALGDADMYQ